MRLAGCGLALVVVSNQRGSAVALVTEGAPAGDRAAIQDAPARHTTCEIDGFYYCPHEVEAGLRLPQAKARPAAAGGGGRSALDLVSLVDDRRLRDRRRGRRRGRLPDRLPAERCGMAVPRPLAADSLAAAAELVCAALAGRRFELGDQCPVGLWRSLARAGSRHASRAALAAAVGSIPERSSSPSRSGASSGSISTPGLGPQQLEDLPDGTSRPAEMLKTPPIPAARTIASATSLT